MEEDLGPFGQLPFLRAYTLMMPCFSLPNGVERSNIVGTLTHAGRTLTSSFPWLGGQVVRKAPAIGSEGTNSGVYGIQPWSHPGGSIVTFKYISDEFPTYGQIHAADAPASLLDGHTLAPMKGVPDHYTDSTPQPVLIIQANFIEGGLLLCFAGMHMAMDGNGLGQVIRLFAKACRGEELTASELQDGNLATGDIVPNLAPDHHSLRHPELRRVIKSDKARLHDATVEAGKELFWTYFRISGPNLIRLKEEASKEAAMKSEWVTTDDAVCSLLWKTITTARSSGFSPSTTITFLRAIDGRACLTPPVSVGYIGNLVAGAFTELPLECVTDSLSLSDIALTIRKATRSIDDDYIRSLAVLIRGEPDRSTILFDVERKEIDFVIASWAKLPVFETFGDILGLPEHFRRPTLTPSEGFAYLMPRDHAGNLYLTLSLTEGDLTRMKKDAVWTSYAEWIG